MRMVRTLRTLSLLTVVAVAALLPLFGDPRPSPVTHPEWARMLLRALALLQPSGGFADQASQVFTTLSGRDSLSYRADRYVKADGIEVLDEPRRVRAKGAVGGSTYPLAVARGGAGGGGVPRLPESARGARAQGGYGLAAGRGRGHPPRAGYLHPVRLRDFGGRTELDGRRLPTVHSLPLGGRGSALAADPDRCLRRGAPLLRGHPEPGRERGEPASRAQEGLGRRLPHDPPAPGIRARPQRSHRPRQGGRGAELRRAPPGSTRERELRRHRPPGRVGGGSDPGPARGPRGSAQPPRRHGPQPAPPRPAGPAAPASGEPRAALRS